jgi:hypothetical protein
MSPDSPERISKPLQGHQSYSVGNAEVVALPVAEQSLVPGLRADTRGYLRKNGVDIGESELIYVQEPCRDPNAALTNLLVIRKTCSLKGQPKISIVLLI